VLGSECDIMYTVYRLSSGGYYKYSSGGTPVYMWSVGYGQEGKDDVGDTYHFRWVGQLKGSLLHKSMVIVGWVQLWATFTV
jgi:hypothetical protein